VVKLACPAIACTSRNDPPTNDAFLAHVVIAATLAQRLWRDDQEDQFFGVQNPSDFVLVSLSAFPAPGNCRVKKVIRRKVRQCR
jgi:hypothetical protein